MKAGSRKWAIAVFAVVLFAIAASGQSFSLYSASNSASTNLFSDGKVNPADQVIPVIEMRDIPLSAVVAALEKQSGINYAIDARVSNSWSIADDEGHSLNNPNVNFRWTNMTAKDALYRLLQEHHLTVQKDPWTTVLLITYQPENNSSSLDATSSGTDTNLVPLISFEDVPLMVALENLARQAHLNYLIDPEIGYGRTDESGNIIHEPTVSHSWTNANCGAVFMSVCRHYHLAAVRDPHTGVVLIRYPGHDVNFVTPDFYGNDTNIIPLIQFEDAPLSVALENLVKQSGLKIILSPQLDSGKWVNEMYISIRWENATARQALAAMCENYDLDVTVYPVSGVVRIEPSD